ncbi:hypothetical protein [Dyella psychrodurans]|uniref:Uncharacterized protein n=1 Tax=Dyella psychrodurans TaxID=1927960 RepID=A0A370XEX1_9GAMM|nr:hypothetical protein [Dyella psychrodurans]RDS86800.1 hypothetical protein DWU99_06110 [Dyella psychrodurans]
MMLPFRRRPTSPKPSPKNADTNVETLEAPPVPAGNVNPYHLDYNHEPLKVEGLSHYFQPIGDERFRVH